MPSGAPTLSLQVRQSPREDIRLPLSTLPSPLLPWALCLWLNLRSGLACQVELQTSVLARACNQDSLACEQPEQPLTDPATPRDPPIRSLPSFSAEVTAWFHPLVHRSLSQPWAQPEQGGITRAYPSPSHAMVSVRPGTASVWRGCQWPVEQYTAAVEHTPGGRFYDSGFKA